MFYSVYCIVSHEPWWHDTDCNHCLLIITYIPIYHLTYLKQIDDDESDEKLWKLCVICITSRWLRTNENTYREFVQNERVFWNISNVIFRFSLVINWHKSFIDFVWMFLLNQSIFEIANVFQYCKFNSSVAS